MSEASGTVRPVGISEADQAVLKFAGKRWLHLGAQEQAIHDQFGWSPTRFWQRVNGLLDDPEAYLAEPQLVKRLRRIRDLRQKDRAPRRVG